MGISYKLITADVLEGLKEVADSSVDMILTSPPYDGLREYGGGMPEIVYPLLLEELFKKTKDGGVCVWVEGARTVKGSESLSPFYHAINFVRVGWRLHDTMIFAKNNPIPGDIGPRYRQSFEYMFCFSKGKPKTFNPITEPTKTSDGVFKGFRVTSKGRGDTPLESVRDAKAERNHSNIFYYNVGSASTRDKFKHPAIMPEKLAEDQIITWTNPGDLVMDPMSGSGTTLKMAVLHGRNAIGIDCVEEYNQIAENRLRGIL